MKFKILYKFSALLFLAFLFQSRSAGPAAVAGLKVDGAPSSGSCANTGCHTSGSFSPSLDIELLDDGTSVDQYEPGKSYTVRVTISAPNSSPNGYGFQASARNTANSSVGTFDAGTAQHVTTIDGNDYLEHNSIGSNGVFESSWTAPAGGAGEVTFYSSGLAINGNGNTSGDGEANFSLSIGEGSPSGTSSINRNYATINIVQNPVGDELGLNISSRASGSFELRITDISGKVVQTEKIFLNSGENQKSFSVEPLEKGIYAVQLCGEKHIAAIQMLKM